MVLFGKERVSASTAGVTRGFLSSTSVSVVGPMVGSIEGPLLRYLTYVLITYRLEGTEGGPPKKKKKRKVKKRWPREQRAT